MGCCSLTLTPLDPVRDECSGASLVGGIEGAGSPAMENGSSVCWLGLMAPHPAELVGDRTLAEITLETVRHGSAAGCDPSMHRSADGGAGSSD